MTLQEILGRLQNVSGPNASGEYMARCPCHDDKTASLSVTAKPSGKDGKTRIYLCCHARCDNRQIMQALGVTPRDLIVDGVTSSGADAPAGVTVHQAKEVRKAAEQQKPQIDFSHPDRVYSYTDAEGREVFQVCRYQYEQDGKREKTFRQRRYDPRNEKANRDGYVMSVPNELRDHTLYRMPAVLAAIREKRPVYVVEGEKDVETLERLGHTATCNPGGAGKWRDGYTEILRDADAIILPDSDTAANDYTGQNHAYQVALSLQGTARRVRLVDLAAACPDLPPKGDITDMVQLLGDTAAMDALARQVAATRDFGPNDVPFWLSPMEQAERLYEQVQGYGVRDGCICQINGENVKKLTDFVTIPRMELIRDDGAAQNLFFVLDGWNSRRQKLGRVTVGAKELDSMGWVTGKWGFSASMAPGTATKDKVAWAIKKVGQLTAKRVTEYSHTGWRKIEGSYCYLFHGGAIGRDGVTVDRGENALRTYRLDGGGAPGFDRIGFDEAAKASLRIREIMKPEIATALLGTVYLAPLREFMAMTDVSPAFALFLYGESGTHKSTAAALAMAHFGNYHSRNAPASFSDTANQIRGKAFLVKDMPIWVDDYHPVSSMQEKRQMASTAQALSRAFGDSADRGRLNADSTLRVSRPPRSVAIITGEDLPAIGASGLSRFFIVDIERTDIPVGKDLTELQEKAREGWLQRAMRGYILWLLQQTDELPERLHDMFIKFREMVRERMDGGHDRAPEAVACILMGISMMLNYMRDVGAVTQEEAQSLQLSALGDLTRASEKQKRSVESEKPTRIFLDSLRELLLTRKVMLKDLSAPPEAQKSISPLDTMVGYMDNEYYYLMPAVAFGAVSKLCREQGVEFPVSLKALYKHLKEDGILRTDGESPTKNRWVDGRAVRLLWVPRDQMDGPKVSQEQQRLNLSGDYQDVTGDEELPF